MSRRILPGSPMLPGAVPMGSRDVECRGKARYRNCGDARRARREIEASPDYVAGRARLRPYVCWYCRDWHLGHRPSPEGYASWRAREALARRREEAP
jgi:hypothetical protein